MKPTQFKRWRRKVRTSILAALDLPSRSQLSALHSEEMYFLAFLEQKRQLGIDMPFFPFGGAANSSLLYILTRAINSLGITSVCELGSGQSTLLLDALAAKHPRLRVDSYEHRRFWACEIETQLQNPERVTILHRELREQTTRGLLHRFYDLPPNIQGKAFDLLLVDGPSGEARNSRWGCLELIDHHLKDEFLIVFDDAERLGEEDTYSEALKLLGSKGIRIHTRVVQAKKQQLLIASERMVAATFF